MITGEAEYLQYLANIANSYNPPNILIRIPVDEPVYKIDLNTRSVETPKFLGVEAEHQAEVIYFIMDRYYDNVDLSNCIGVVQFKNARNEEYMWVIPAYDVTSVPNKLIFGWNIQSPITKYGGNVQFSFKFFKMDKTSGELLYELNTLVVKTKVLVGWASYGGFNHHDYLNYPVERILSDPGIVPVLNDQGEPTYNEDGEPVFEVTGYGIWAKVQDIFDKNKEFNVYWEDAT